MKRWTALAGTVAVLGGTALTVMGAVAPSAQAATTAAYNCTMHTSTLGDRPFSMTMDISGNLPGSVQQGDDATLTGFQTVGHVPASVASILVGLGATSVSGSYDSFEVDAAINDVSLPAAHPQMDIEPVPVTPVLGSFDMIAPSSSTDVTFTASQPGELTVSAAGDISGTLVYELLVGGPKDIPFDCTGAQTPIDSTTVKEKPTLPTHTHASIPSQPHSTPPSQSHSQPPSSPTPTNSAPNGLAHLSPSSTPSSSANVPANNDANNNEAVSRQKAKTSKPTLAKTGASDTVPLSLSGGILVLLGAGLMLLASRRRPRTNSPAE